MVDSLILKYFSLGEKQDTCCNLTLSSVDNSHILCFECDSFLFKIILNDIVDLEEFLGFLEKKEKKIELNCFLDKDKREYKGKKKLIWREGNIAVSQGGIRIEFEAESQKNMLDIIKGLKSRQ